MLILLKEIIEERLSQLSLYNTFVSYLKQRIESDTHW